MCLEELRHQLLSQGGDDVSGSSMVSEERSVSLKGSDNTVCLAWVALLVKDSSSECLSNHHAFALDWASPPSPGRFQTTGVLTGFSGICASFFAFFVNCTTCLSISIYSTTVQCFPTFLKLIRWKKWSLSSYWKTINHKVSEYAPVSDKLKALIPTVSKCSPRRLLPKCSIKENITFSTFPSLFICLSEESTIYSNSHKESITYYIKYIIINH